MKKTVIMGIDKTINRIKRTANLEVIGSKGLKGKAASVSLSCP